jgi:hypothetical protein
VSDVIALLVVGLAAAAVIVLVAVPLLRSGSREERLDALTDGQRRRLALREERDAALAGLRELEFDHRTGKITDEDYRPLVAGYRRRVAGALQALDAGEATPHAGPTAEEPAQDGALDAADAPQGPAVPADAPRDDAAR